METLFIGKNTLFLSEVESTNSYAMDLLRNVNILDGTVISTEKQTKGRGQRGSEWIAQDGKNITVSIVLKPNFLNTKHIFYLSKITALACYDVLTDFATFSHNDIKIKWPNDILINSKKTAGILIENTYSKSTILYSVIGLGLNINQTSFNNIATQATSLKIENKFSEDYDKKIILEKFCQHLEKWYLRLKELKFELIDSSYHEKLFGVDKQVEMINNLNNIAFKAKLIGVTTDGKLHLRKDELNELFFDIKEVSFIL